MIRLFSGRRFNFNNLIASVVNAEHFQKQVFRPNFKRLDADRKVNSANNTPITQKYNCISKSIFSKIIFSQSMNLRHKSRGIIH